jgi:hypothetical protein
MQIWKENSFVSFSFSMSSKLLIAITILRKFVKSHRKCKSRGNKCLVIREGRSSRWNSDSSRSCSILVLVVPVFSYCCSGGFVPGFSTCRHLVGQIFLYFHQLVDFNLATKSFSNMLFLFIYLQKKLALATLQLIWFLLAKQKVENKNKI